MTYREAYEQGKRLLAEYGIEEAGTDARLLLEYVCHTDYQTLYTQGERVLDELQADIYVNYLEKRADRIPLQYLTHTQSFMGLDFYVNEHTLIPRSDTEILVEEVMRYGQDGMAILDLCTGSGCILLSLLHYSNGCFGVGTDVSKEALAVAEGNAKTLGFGEKMTQGELFFLQGDLYDALEEKLPAFDVIVSNPPYIRSEVIPTLMPEVKEHEPRLALDGGGDGLMFYRRIIDGAPAHVKRESALFFEIGADQGDAVKELMLQAGYRDVRIVKDYAGLDRVVYGVRIAG
ncbi:MAG: peptide chain release factor N(5)-glutamine methyltransferase [Lachnospiraceae bacterium]|nr:peptide chain release factor N(5)-glutamine methyltransferase [Lachnospiraceae bacterium]MDE7238178.1 peptide chain release factor N(5)-glutamine methyltransferase [Lachnospiraceae bacterium]